MNRITRSFLDDDTFSQVSLPVSKGGLGIALSMDTRVPAFLGSYVQSLPLQNILLDYGCVKYQYPHRPEFVDALVSFNDKLPQEMKKLDLNTLSTYSNPQTVLSNIVQEAKFNQLVESAATLNDKVRLKMVSGQYSGLFLNAVPIANLNQTMSNPTFVKALKLRLGLPIFEKAQSCPKCHKEMGGIYLQGR